MWYDGLVSGVWNFLLYGSSIIIGGLLIGVATYPVWIKKLYPIPLLIIKNAGGAKDSNTIVLDRDVVRYARRVNTPYGARIKIRGVADTQPVSLISRENAIPWEKGGVAFIVYEKEVGQYTAVNPGLQEIEFLEAQEKARGDKIRALFKTLQEEVPQLRDHIRLVNPSKTLSPVTFLNHSVHIRPFPADLVTPTMYEMKIRQERVHKEASWAKWLPYAVMGLLAVAVIVIAILSYDQVNKSIDDRLAAMRSSEDSLAQKITDKMASSETGPGGRIIFPLIPLGGLMMRRRRLGS